MLADQECSLVLHYWEWHGDDLQYIQYKIILRKLTSPKHVIVERFIMTTCMYAWWESQQQHSTSCTGVHVDGNGEGNDSVRKIHSGI